MHRRAFTKALSATALLGPTITSGTCAAALSVPSFIRPGEADDYIIDFTEGAAWNGSQGQAVPLADLISVARETPRYAATAAGDWQYIPPRAAAVTDAGLHVDAIRTNHIRNNAMVGAAAGTPGTLPTYWAITDLPNGLSQQITGIGREDGIDYIDIRLVGTSTGGTLQIWFDTQSGIPATQGDHWTLSAFIKGIHAEADTAGIGWCALGTDILAGGGPIAFPGSAVAPGLTTSGLTRCRSAFIYYIVEDCDHIQPYMAINIIAGARDVTLRIGWPQAENVQHASSPVRTIGTASSYQADIITPGSRLLQVLQGPTSTVIVEIDGASPTNRGDILTDSNGAALCLDGTALMSLASDSVTINGLADIATRHILGVASDSTGRIVTASAMGMPLASHIPRGSGPHYLGSNNGRYAINGRIRRIRVASRKMAPDELRLACRYHPRTRVGAYFGDGVYSASAFQTLLGRQVDLLSHFVAYHDWAEFDEGLDRGFRIWSRYPNTRLVCAVPLGVIGTTLADILTGIHDRHFAILGAKAVGAGRADTIFRIGWEANGDWYPWRAQASPTNWIKAYRHIVDLLRAVPGQSFQFAWTLGAGADATPPPLFYPGNGYTDFIGMDIYNEWSYARNGGNDPVARWRDDSVGYYDVARQDAAPFALAWLGSFARAQGKPILFGEVGTGVKTDGHGALNDPYFIRQFAAWIAQHDVYGLLYWDTHTDYWGRLSRSSVITGSVPPDPRDEQSQAAMAFRAAFG